MTRTLTVFLTTWALSASSVAIAGGSVHVRGYTRKDGTYVAPYTRSAPHAHVYSFNLPSSPPVSYFPAPEPTAFPGASRLNKPPRSEPRTRPRTSPTHRHSDEDWEEHVRDWKNREDKVVATGRFLSSVGKYLWVKTRDGHREKLLIDDLSDEDMKYLRTRAWEQVTASTK
jgi:hypothetical protein